MTELKRVAIVGSARIPFARGGTAYADETNLSMLGTVLGGLADKFGLKGEKVDEVIAGAVINHSRDFNLAREALLDAGFSPRTPGTTMQIACGTSLQAALVLAGKIASGQIESGIAAGSDTVSDSPIVFGPKFQHRLLDANAAKTIQPVLENFDPEAEEASASLGASRWQTVWAVILPSLYPALITGFALLFARAVGEYGSVVFVAGNMPYKTEIAPILIVARLEEFAYSEATAIAPVPLSDSPAPVAAAMLPPTMP